MADLIPLRRGEVISSGGEPTQRFIEWAESLTNQGNTNSTDITTNNIITVNNTNEITNTNTVVENNTTQITNNTTEITNTNTREAFPWPTNPLASDSQMMAVTAVSDYAASNYDFINATQDSTITLVKYPVENSVIILRNGDGSRIKFSGNGKNINGSSSGSITRKGTAITLQYFIDTDEWFAR